MSLRSSNKTAQKRRGVILLVVLAMLTLLAIIGITFVMYATSLEQCSEAAIDEQKSDYKPRMDPETALSMFLGQFVYDVEDDTSGKYSVLRGHSLARDLYGYKAATGGQVAFPLDRPFGGLGYSDPTQPNFIGQPSVPGQPNVPYTAPDTNHWYLAKLSYNQAGQINGVLDPSFWRTNYSDANGVNYTGTFRYKPGNGQYNMAPGFPVYPTNKQDFDVQNLPWGSKNDSIWIDINAPVQTLPNGRKYKMMVAPLITDLDGRLNLAMAGNRMVFQGGGWTHGSHEGFGPWEGNVDRVVSSLRNQGDPGLTTYNLSAIQSTLLSAKYGGTNAQPSGYSQSGGASGTLGGGVSPRAHYQMDFNGGIDPANFNLTGPVPAYLPGAGVGANYSQAFPFFHPGMFGNSALVETTSNGQSTGNFIHPISYNPLFPMGTNIAFNIRDMGPFMLWRADKDTFAKDVTNSFSPTKQGLSPLLSNYGEVAYRSAFFDHTTLISADFDKPGIYPFFDNKIQNGLRWPNPTNATAPFWPRRVGNNFTQPASPVAEQNSLGLATTDLTKFARINLVNFGPDYPPIQDATGQYAADANSTLQATLADQGRTLLAYKVLEGLCAATGAINPFDQNLPTDWYDSSKPTTYFFSTSNENYKASLWLAQLAVNIVDFVDPDDVMTRLVVSNPKDSGGSKRTVFGTELPKVVINEVYAQLDNSNADFTKPLTMGANDDFKVSLYLELLNSLNDPNSNTTNVYGSSKAVLQVGTHVVYHAEIAKNYQIDPNNSNQIISAAPPGLKDFFASDLSGIENWLATNSLSQIPSWVPTNNNTPIVINPIGTNSLDASKTGANGILIVGPALTNSFNDTSPTIDPTFAPGVEVNTLQYIWTKNDKTTPDKTAESIVLLRRLANPGKPLGTDNPYILVDYVTVTKDMINEARNKTVDKNKTPNPTQMTSRVSYGRRQPFAGKVADSSITDPTQIFGAYVPQAPTTAQTSAPQHTFGKLNFKEDAATGVSALATRANNTMETPDWLAHFDRKPVSPLGLALVSTYRPHDLSQKFLDQIPDPSDNTKTVWVPHQHCAAWFDEMTGLQRFFELVQTHGEYSLQNSNNKMVPLFPMGGRFMGKVNLNTVPIYFSQTTNQYESPVLEALFDANNSNRFTSNQVKTLIQRLGSSRANNNYLYGWNAKERSGSLLQSIASAAPTSANYDPLQYNQNTYPLPQVSNYQPYNGNFYFDPFAADPTAQPNGAPQRTMVSTIHPAVRLEALEKIFNQTTVRSNVFAIWLTVGFFEVVDGNATPVKLGGEIGASAGRQVRHKMFAIVDRTRIKSFEITSTQPITANFDNTTADYTYQNVPFTSNSNIYDPRTQKTYNLLTIAKQNPQQPLVLTFDPDTESEETVELTVFNNQLMAQFRRNHVQGCKIISRGNPGPMVDYNHDKDKDVVLYWTILE